MRSKGIAARNPGERLRAVRLRLGFSLREVEAKSLVIATELHDRRFALPFARLHDIETNGVVPNIFRLYTLACIYRQDMRNLLRWYGVPFR